MSNYTRDEILAMVRSGANLRYANLRYANLRNADLSGANLRGADLRGADLRDAYLRGANLSDANLSDANLSDANLHWSVGNGCEIKTMLCGTYHISFTADTMAIGCQQHKIEEWFAFSDEIIDNMDSGALDWWRVWKPIIQQVIEVAK